MKFMICPIRPRLCSAALFFFTLNLELLISSHNSFFNLLLILRARGFCFVLFCFVLFCFVLFCFVLFCFVFFCFVLFCFVLFCFVLFCFVLLSFFIILVNFLCYRIF